MKPPDEPHAALATCPWCDWQHEAFGDSLDEVVREAKELIAAHNVEMGHEIFAGREPHLGMYKGEPIS